MAANLYVRCLVRIVNDLSNKNSSDKKYYEKNNNNYNLYL